MQKQWYLQFMVVSGAEAIEAPCLSVTMVSRDKIGNLFFMLSPIAIAVALKDSLLSTTRIPVNFPHRNSLKYCAAM